MKLGKAFGIPVVDAFPFDGFDKNISKIATCVAGQSNNEGIVVRFDTGQMIKIKADEYVRKHRSKDLISSQKGIINLILEDKLDDVLPQLDEAVRDKATDYQHQVNFICAEIASDIQSFVEDREAYEQKAFALDVQKHLPKRWQSATYNVRKGDDPLTAVKNTLLSNCKTSKDATAFLDAVDIPLWSFSFFSEE